ncbi:MAG: hypothetical protein O8C67_06050 [Candidatus Methanoperedens sp.]|nr:hypothetical protein [Candidatus Methanoperedens sp.]
MAKKWIQGMGMTKGALHRHLGIPESKKIPHEMLVEASGKPGTIGKEARLAMTLSQFHHHEKQRGGKPSPGQGKL